MVNQTRELDSDHADVRRAVRTLVSSCRLSKLKSMLASKQAIVVTVKDKMFPPADQSHAVATKATLNLPMSGPSWTHCSPRCSNGRLRGSCKNI